MPQSAKNTIVRVAEPAARTSVSTTRNEVPITDSDIARRAYDLYLARGREPGHQLEDWLQAEQDLRRLV